MRHKNLRTCGLLATALVFCHTCFAQAPQVPAQQISPVPQNLEESRRQRAEEQLKEEERQRILGFIPSFNTINVPDAVALSPRQKWELALKGALDPFVFGVDALNAGISQIEDQYPEYKQGVAGFSRRFGANYADSFDGEMLGNALLPILLHEDPRYFRKGTGSIKSRMWYAMESTVRAKSDNGRWVLNYGNILGNFAAGGIANLYYPASERGLRLTAERSLTVTAEGALGALGYEFWPDIRRHYANRHKQTSLAASQ